MQGLMLVHYVQSFGSIVRLLKLAKHSKKIDAADRKMSCADTQKCIGFESVNQ